MARDKMLNGLIKALKTLNEEKTPARRDLSLRTIFYFRNYRT